VWLTVQLMTHSPLDMPDDAERSSEPTSCSSVDSAMGSIGHGRFTLSAWGTSDIMALDTCMFNFDNTDGRKTCAWLAIVHFALPRLTIGE